MEIMLLIVCAAILVRNFPSYDWREATCGNKFFREKVIGDER